MRACLAEAILPDGEIHVWLGHLVDDEDRTAQLASLLDSEEAARAAGFACRRVRMHFIQSHGMARQVLARYTGDDAAELRFARGRYGKPRLIRSQSGPDLHFSLSHSGSCFIIALTFRNSVGADIEQVRDLPQAMEIARRHFAAPECRLLARQRGARRRNAFFTLWTCKEAVTKARGGNLATTLGETGLDIDSTDVGQPSSPNNVRMSARGYPIVSFDPLPGYMAAVASKHPFRTMRQYTWG